VEYLVQKARTYIYTTAMPPALAVATMKSLDIVRSDNWRRAHLAGLVQRFRSEVSGMGYELMPSDTPIQPILIGDNESALALSRALEERGLLVTAIRPPTVPAGEARLRVTLSASHSKQDLDCLLEALQNCCPLARAPETRSLAAV
jgi:8-amino-7-oxononanoate synthase